MIDAEVALATGLLNEVVEPGELMNTAYDYVERIAADAPLAVSATKQSAVDGLTMDMASALDKTRHRDRIFAAEDAKEGPRAFAGKRSPHWRGH